jgi:hypothetical protein
MIADGTLLLYAELSRLRRLAHNCGVKIRCVPPRSAKVAQVLKQIGIFDLLGFGKKIEPTYADVIHWRTAKGNDVNGEKYDRILGHYEGRIADALGKRFFCGITEAMTNCNHHAYIEKRADGLDIEDEAKEWWMFSQERDGFLTVVFCDLGIGIPRSLPIKKPAIWRRVLTFQNNLDAHAIREAIGESKTRTGKHHRGKGLRQLIEVISNTPNSMVKIFSNKGCFSVTPKGETPYQYKDSILGTLIHWSVPIGDSSDGRI